MAARRLDSAADAALAFACLPDADRATVRAWEFVLGLPPDGWQHVPPLRAIVVAVAALYLASGMEGLSAADALSEAFASLGVEDDTDTDARLSDSLDRRLRAWRAWAASGNSLPRARRKPAADCAP